MRISAHFTLAELTRSAVAARRGLANRPDGDTVSNLTRIARDILEPVRARFAIPFSPTSGYRSLALNRAIGSRDTSQHIRGEAVDFTLPGVPNLELARWVRDHLEFDQLILEFWRPGDPAAGWVHVSKTAGSNRGEVLSIGHAGVRHGLPEN